MPGKNMFCLRTAEPWSFWPPMLTMFRNSTQFTYCLIFYVNPFTFIICNQNHSFPLSQTRLWPDLIIWVKTSLIFQIFHLTFNHGNVLLFFQFIVKNKVSKFWKYSILIIYFIFWKKPNKCSWLSKSYIVQE